MPVYYISYISHNPFTIPANFTIKMSSAMNDEEEELLCLMAMAMRKKQRRWYVRPLNETRDEEGEFSMLVRDMRSFDEEKHFSYFRMNRQKFDDLVERLAPFLQHRGNHRSPINAAQRLAVALRVLATGCSEQCVSASYRLGTSTVSAIVSEVCQAIWEALQSEYVAFPSGHQWTVIARDFWRLWDYPLLLGALDGKHIQIRCPPGAGSDFFNYKGTHSLVLLAVCDAYYRFTMVDVGAFGRQSDGGILQESEFGQKLLSGALKIPPPDVLPGTDVTSPHVFVGDAAFPLHENLMRPYPGSNLEEPEQVYNYRHCRARRIIENAFGIMSARWRILGRPIDFHPSKTVQVVKACVALHNWLTHTDDRRQYIPPNYADTTTPSGDILPGEWRQVVGQDDPPDPQSQIRPRATRTAYAVRNNLRDFFTSPHGLVPWQTATIRRGRLNIE